MRDNTPPSSIQGDEFIPDEEEMIYIGDADEVLDNMADDVQDFDMDRSDDDEYLPKDDAVRTFDVHSGSVFCCSFHPCRKIAVTGGEDDKAYVWNTETNEVINECIGHKDSVVIAAFSHDGVYLATADMGGTVFVWKCNFEEQQSTPWSVAWEYQTGDICWGQWHTQARVLICGTSEGDIYVWKIPSGETKILQGHGSKSESGLVLFGGTCLAAGYDDGLVKIWDLKTSTVVHYIVPEPSVIASVTSIDTNLEGTLLVTGTCNGKALLSTIATGKKVGILDNGSELECVSFCKEPQMPYLATGTLYGDVKIWDIPKQMVRHICSQKVDEDSSGVTKLLWVKNFLVAACLDGALRIYEGRSGELLEVITGHKSEILELTYNHKEGLLLTASDDKTAKLFKSKTLSDL